MSKQKNTTSKTTGRPEAATTTNRRSAPRLKQLKTQLPPRTYAKSLLQKLEKQGLKTLADIRRQGKIGVVEGLTEKQQADVQKLEAHAYLILFSEDIPLNEKLIVAGYRDVSAIAEADPAALAKAAGISAEDAKAFQAKAIGFLSAPQTGVHRGLSRDGNSNGEVKACNSALSPLAYLEELLTYAAGKADTGVEGHIENTPEWPIISRPELEALLYHPFERLTHACEEVDKKVRQVRIAVEVLRRHLGEQQPASDDILPYLKAAYFALLRQAGTSYDELRRLRAATPGQRRALANRLGISLSESRPDELDQLLFADLTRLTEPELERVFGLQDTCRDPLSNGDKQDDSSEQVKSWHFTFPENIQPQAEKLCLYLQRLGERVEAHLFLPEDSNNILALGRLPASVNAGRITLEPLKDSGYSGYVIVDYQGDNDRIYFLFPKPDLLTWRLWHLRHLWQQQDALTDPYTNGELPVIDPDVIGPEDFRSIPTVTGSSAGFTPFQLWEKRRRWVDDRLRAMAAIRFPTDNTPRPADADILAGMLAIMNQFISYPREDQSMSPRVRPWATTVGIEEVLHRHAVLKKGNEPDDQKTWIQQHYLTVDSFSRLVEIAERVVAEEVITEEAWREVESILVQAQKLVFQRAWIEEQVPAGTGNLFSIRLLPQHFWLALTEPEEGVWTPALRADRPLLDPTVVAREDLALPPIGNVAKAIWKARNDQLSEPDAAIEQAYQQSDGGFVDALNTAYRVNQDEYAWSEAFGVAPNDLAAAWSVFALYPQEFLSLQLLWHKYLGGQTLDAAEVEQLLLTLTIAHKRKWVWPEEENDLAYWQILKTRLPKWRASQEIRKGWQYALTKRSQPPVVDPDRIRLEPHEDEPSECKSAVAANLYAARDQWIAGVMEELDTIKDRGDFKKIGREGSLPGAFILPFGVAADSQGNLYVTDRDNKRVQKFNPAGEFVLEWNGAEIDGGFNHPVGIAIDRDDRVYVVDRMKSRVSIFDSKGNYIGNFGASGTGDGQFSNPQGIAIDRRNRIYVADTGNHRIQVFDRRGVFLRKWGSQGYEEGAFNVPCDVYIDL